MGERVTQHADRNLEVVLKTPEVDFLIPLLKSRVVYFTVMVECKLSVRILEIN